MTMLIYNGVEKNRAELTAEVQERGRLTNGEEGPADEWGRGVEAGGEKH